MAGLNQWIQKHRRPKSAVYLPSTTSTTEKCENRRTMSWAQPLSQQQQQQHQQQQQQQKQQNLPHHHEPTSMRTSLDCGLTIPARNTSKHYTLDTELQAKVDRVVSSDKIRLLSQRVQRQRIQSMRPCPPATSETMTTLPFINAATSPIQEEEQYDSQYHPQHQPKKLKRASNQYYYQQYNPILNNRSYHHTSPPPPPPHHFS